MSKKGMLALGMSSPEPTVRSFWLNVYAPETEIEFETGPVSVCHA